jgi:glutaredoxin
MHHTAARFLHAPTCGLSLARRAALLGTLAALTLAPMPAWALFKVVAPDGSVTYTDRPPATTQGRVTQLGRQADAAPEPPPLPLELRQAVQRHPVTLYTAAECQPCDAARSMLLQRGIPYTERRILENDDVLALERLVGGRTVPALTIGAQALRGYAGDEWAGYLDAAGYPRDSRLPRGWQAPPPTPLAPRRAAVRAAEAVAEPVPAAPLALPQTQPDTPGTIRF